MITQQTLQEWRSRLDRNPVTSAIWADEIRQLLDEVDRLNTLTGDLASALKQISVRGPVPGHSMVPALKLRIVGIQSIARDALAKIPAP